MLAPPYSNLCSQGTSSHRQNGALPIAAPDSVPPGIRSRPRSPQSGTRPLKAPSRTAPVIRQRAALGRHSVQDPPGHGMMSRRPSRPAPGSGARDQAAVVLARYAAHCGSPSGAAPISRQRAPRGTAGGQRRLQPISSISRPAFPWLHFVQEATQFSQAWMPPRLHGTTSLPRQSRGNRAAPCWQGSRPLPSTNGGELLYRVDHGADPAEKVLRCRSHNSGVITVFTIRRVTPHRHRMPMAACSCVLRENATRPVPDRTSPSQKILANGTRLATGPVSSAPAIAPAPKAAISGPSQLAVTYRLAGTKNTARESIAPTPRVAITTPTVRVRSTGLPRKNLTPARNSSANPARPACPVPVAAGIRIDCSARKDTAKDAALMISAHCTPKTISSGAAIGVPMIEAKL